MVENAKKQYFIFSLLLSVFSLFLLMGCQSSKEVVDETNERLILNENVTFESFKKIKIRETKNEEGGMTYEEVLDLMGGITPQFESEIIGKDDSSELEAHWWRYNRRHQFGTDLIGVKFIDGKAFSKFEEGLE